MVLFGGTEDSGGTGSGVMAFVAIAGFVWVFLAFLCLLLFASWNVMIESSLISFLTLFYDIIYSGKSHDAVNAVFDLVFQVRFSND